MTYEAALVSIILVSVKDAFRELLTAKHLYQSTNTPSTLTDSKAREFHEEAIRKTSQGKRRNRLPSLEEIRTASKVLFDLPWYPSVPEPYFRTGQVFPSGNTTEPIRALEFELPTIRTTCSEKTCRKDEPFNPVKCERPTTHGCHFNYPNDEQDFVLQYQCQACKGRPITFLVHRSNDKLTLCGREPMEIVTVPAEIPKNHRTHFSSAIIAHQSGQHLPAIFMLRVFIEQYWLSFPTVHAAANTTRISGETMGEEYKKLLPDDFKRRFPTLLETYGQLSVAIHTAKADETAFTEAKQRILKHFEALRAFELDLTRDQPQVAPESAQ